MSDDLLSKGKLDPAKLAEIFKGVRLPDSSLFGSGLDKISFGLGSRNDGPDYYRQSEYSADPRKVALREAKEKEATVALGNQPVSIPVIIPKNPSGNTDYTYIVGKLHEAGLDVSAPLMKRVFDPRSR